MSFIERILSTGLALTAIGMCFSLSSANDEQTDLEIYLDEIREQGIAESAQSTLRGITNLFVGSGLVRFCKDSRGQYWAEVHVRGPCSGGDEIAKRVRASEDSLIHRLKPIVDEDRSGFVSIEEAKAFRRTIEFGYFCIQMAEEGRIDLKSTVDGVAVSEELARAQLTRYRDYRQKCMQLGLSLPDPPEGRQER